MLHAEAERQSQQARVAAAITLVVEFDPGTYKNETVERQREVAAAAGDPGKKASVKKAAPVEAHDLLATLTAMEALVTREKA